MFRLRYIGGGKLNGQNVKKSCGSMWYTMTCINNQSYYKILTKGKGHSWNTKKGVEKFYNSLADYVKKDFVVIEYLEVINA